VAAALILGAWSWHDRTIAVTHGVIGSTYIDNGATGPSVGDVRLFQIATAPAKGGAGRMDAVMTTTGPAATDGSEIRMAQLIFTFGNEADQIVVTGAGVYPAAGSVLAENTTTVRPITGGSGIYSGAHGWCESIHYADGTWRHIFHLER
jgi:hypothetical protein